MEHGRGDAEDLRRGPDGQPGGPLQVDRAEAWQLLSALFEHWPPQEPKPPYPYDKEEITYAQRDGERLAGTLTLPRGRASVSAVLLISGSGPQNRDEEIFGHKPFAVIADYLTRRGVAVLRLDDRGVGRSTGSVPDSTSENFATDVL